MQVGAAFLQDLVGHGKHMRFLVPQAAGRHTAALGQTPVSNGAAGRCFTVSDFQLACSDRDVQREVNGISGSGAALLSERAFLHLAH